jgi:hypothetical protein
MISRDDLVCQSNEEFDARVRAALRERVAHEQPSPRVRESLLCTATARRQQVVKASVNESLAGYGYLRSLEFERARVDDPATMGMLQAHMRKIHVVL